MCSLPAEETNARRGLDAVSRWRDRRERERQGLLLAKTDRPSTIGRIHAAGPRSDFGGRRRRCGEQLHAILSGAVRPASLRSVSQRASGILVIAELVSGQPILDQCMVTNDPGAAVDHVGIPARATDRAIARYPRIVSFRSDAMALSAMPRLEAQPAACELGSLLSCDR